MGQLLNGLDTHFSLPAPTSASGSCSGCSGRARQCYHTAREGQSERWQHPLPYAQVLKASDQLALRTAPFGLAHMPRHDCLWPAASARITTWVRDGVGWCGVGRSGVSRLPLRHCHGACCGWCGWCGCGVGVLGCGAGHRRVHLFWMADFLFILMQVCTFQEPVCAPAYTHVYFGSLDMYRQCM